MSMGHFYNIYSIITEPVLIAKMYGSIDLMHNDVTRCDARGEFWSK